MERLIGLTPKLTSEAIKVLSGRAITLTRQVNPDLPPQRVVKLVREMIGITRYESKIVDQYLRTRRNKGDS